MLCVSCSFQDEVRLVQLKEDLDKSQQLTDSMVRDLMVVQFMQCYSRIHVFSEKCHFTACV